MATFIERRDYEFLMTAAKFCSKIDNYITVIKLDENEVDELKNDSLLFYAGNVWQQ